jgi:hypothetical protein
MGIAINATYGVGQGRSVPLVITRDQARTVWMPGALSPTEENRPWMDSVSMD